MRRVVALIAAALLLGGCGIGPGEEQEGGAVIRVTRDFGHEEIASTATKTLQEDETVMRMMQSKFDVETRFGGRFVQSIDGVKGAGPSGMRDWFFFVNGVESEVGAAEHELSPGDRVQWDFRDWGTAMRVAAIVGAFPEPFLNGIDGRRRPVRVECDQAESDPCRAAKDALDRVNVPVSGSSLGAPGTESVTRLVVARWPAARIVRGGLTLEEGPESSGVFARFAKDGRSLDLLDADGDVARTVHAGDGTGVGGGAAPARRGAALARDLARRRRAGGRGAALRENTLRDAFAVAVTGRVVEKLPLEER